MDIGTSKFKESPFIVGGEVKKGNFFTLSCPTRGRHEQMHCYFSKWSITFSTHMLLMSMSFLIASAKNIFACIWRHICSVLAHFCIWKLPVFKQSVRVVMRWSCCMRSSTIIMQKNNFFSILYISAQITWSLRSQWIWNVLIQSWCPAVGYICDSNLSDLLNQNIAQNSFNIVHHS